MSASVPSVSIEKGLDPQNQEDTYVHDVYNEIASHFSQTRYKPWPIVEKFLTQRPKYSIGLDVGCGNGKYLSVNKDVFIIGTDRSEGLVRCAQQISENKYNLGVADGLALPHPESTFDFAISIAVIHHFANEERRIEAISHIVSKLKVGGEALIYCWALEQENSRRGYKDGDDQDILIPWVLKKPQPSKKKKKQQQQQEKEENEQQIEEPEEVTKYRYYHLYKKCELADNCLKTGCCNRHDKLVRATDLDALSCRHSINEKSYLIPRDEFIDDLIKSYHTHLPYCAGYTQMSSSRTLRSLFQEKKFPLINRGSYLRTMAINRVVEGFIKEFDGKCQIVSLGSGSDTRAFPILQSYKDVVYHEIDFPESARIKKLAILQNQRLREIVNTTEPEPVVNSKESFAEYSCDLHTENYHLHGLDLRTLDHTPTGFDTNVPTLIISECVLCYLSPEEYTRAIKFWTHRGGQTVMGFLIYEPMSLNDQFGATMAQNLLSRGLNLQTFSKYPDLITRKTFLENTCGLDNVKLTDLSAIGGYESSDRSWIGDEELVRINKLEFIDEIEEIQLLLKHYCLIYGEYPNKEKQKFNGVDLWKW
ncbi:PPM1 Leucine carboxyl methyltransferase 1 [Candida maltosa Xu316]